MRDETIPSEANRTGLQYEKLQQGAHTPGPWRSGREHSSQAAAYIDTQNGVDEIAVVYNGGDFDRARANARLIAAAPDMLAVIRDMLSGLSYLRFTKNIPYGFGIDRLEEAGLAAIGKATNERTEDRSTLSESE